MMKNQIFKETKVGYPNADNVMKNGVLLPLHHGLTEQMLERFRNVVIEFLSNY